MHTHACIEMHTLNASDKFIVFLGECHAPHQSTDAIAQRMHAKTLSAAKGLTLTVSCPQIERTLIMSHCKRRISSTDKKCAFVGFVSKKYFYFDFRSMESCVE